MKKTLKTLLSLALVLVLALGCLSGFAASAEELEQVTLKVWVAGTGPQKDTQAVFAKFNEQLPAYLPNTTIDFLAVSAGEYGEKWSKAMAAQEQIDVAWFGWVQNMNDEIAMGSVLPLNALIAEYGQDMVASLGQSTLDAHSVGGEIYAIPCWQASAVQSVQGIYLRTDVLDALPNQNFFEEFKALQREVVQMDYHDQEAHGMVYDKLEEYMMGAIDAQIPCTGFDDVSGRAFGKSSGYESTLAGYVLWGDDTFTLHSKYIAGTEAAELELYRLSRQNEFWNKGYYRSDLLTADQLGYNASNPSSEVCAMGGHSAVGLLTDLYTQEEINARISQHFNMGIEMVVTTDKVVAEQSFSTATCIPYTSKNPERAMMYINLMNSPKGAELYQTLVYGIEGQHWNRIDETYVEVVGGKGQATSDWMYGQWKWAVGSCVNTLTQEGEDPEYWAKMSAAEQGAVINPLMTFAVDYTNVDVERLNCNAIIAEYTNLFAYDNYAELVQERNDKLMAAGYDVLHNEVKAQLAAYVEALTDKTWPSLYN